jgi:hypothetical protein
MLCDFGNTRGGKISRIVALRAILTILQARRRLRETPGRHGQG